MDIPTQFNQEDTHKIQNEVRQLFASMSDEFREHFDAILLVDARKS